LSAEPELILKDLVQLPDLLQLHRLAPQRYPLLLDSVARATADSRFSVLFALPQQRICCHRLDEAQGWFDAMDAALQQTPRYAPLAEWPFQGGWAAFLSYELAQAIEPSTGPTDTLEEWPVAELIRFPAAVICDWQREKAALIVEPQWRAEVDNILDDLATIQPLQSRATPQCPAELNEETPDQYLHQVDKARYYIREGDIFQTNLSRLWRSREPLPFSAADLYQRLCETNPAPFAVLWAQSGRSLISSSPERLFSLHGQMLSTRPIAGTHPRAADPETDKELAKRLLQHPKERAEHVMLIDLERNDLGRVCEPGSIRVSELMTLESYEHVHHIVSCVEGQCRADVRFSDIIRALFPGGTITGCPKVRCMQIITEMEQSPRGPYTGSVGYISQHGRSDFNILIRTLWTHQGHWNFRAGAGIVADSDAHKELEETRHKARGMARVFD